MKTRGKLSAENPHAGFDVAGAGNVLCFYRGAPDLDPTDEGELEIGHCHYASSPLYLPSTSPPIQSYSIPPACENNGYVIVEVSPTQVKIQYKSYLGDVVDETVLT